MKTVKYVGDPNDNFSGPRTIRVKGLTFTKGEEVLVEDNVHKHFLGHSHFEAEGKEPVEAEEVGVTHSDEEMKAILKDRGIKVPRGATSEDLNDAVMTSGGYPEPEVE